jgi:hypothetical protein
MPAKCDYKLEKPHKARCKSACNRMRQILNYTEHACYVQPVLTPTQEVFVYYTLA